VTVRVAVPPGQIVAELTVKLGVGNTVTVVVLLPWQPFPLLVAVTVKTETDGAETITVGLLQLLQLNVPVLGAVHTKGNPVKTLIVVVTVDAVAHSVWGRETDGCGEVFVEMVAVDEQPVKLLVTVTV
jgi:hypothetical protein